MKLSRRASVIRLLATMVVAMLFAACGSRTPLNYIPTFGDGIDDDDTDSDPDASRDRDASTRTDTNTDRSVDARNENDVVEGGRDGADVRDALDAADRCDIADTPDIPDIPPCFAES